MDDKEKSYATLLEMIDDGEKIINNDRLSEEKDRVRYFLEREKIKEVSSSPKDCQKCSLYLDRRYYAEPIIKENSKLLFLSPYPEGDSIFIGDSLKMFYRWVDLLHLNYKEYSLLSVIKCPIKVFSKESAELCKEYLEKEIELINAEYIVLFGGELAHYYFGEELSYIETLYSALDNPLSLYGAKTYLMYSPSDVIRFDRNKRPNWMVLKLLDRLLHEVR